jgi:hypothetical protein
MKVESFAAVVAENLPWPGEPNAGTLLASELGVGGSGLLRAVAVLRPSSVTDHTYSALVLKARPLEGDDWEMASDETVTDAVGRPGHVGYNGKEYSITMPREEGERKGEVIMIADERSPFLDAAILACAAAAQLTEALPKA